MSEEKAFRIIQKLCENGCKSYLTGGAVRDLFFGIDPIDYDVVTEAVPDQIDEIFNGHDIRHVGRAFEVSLVDGIEVAGYRKDTYFGFSDKNVTIEPAETLEEDLARRDLTINSMAFCPYTNELIDPYHGRADLKNRIIRFTGKPEHRIWEDPCRIIRACRFVAKIEGVFAEDTLDALCSNWHLVKHVAPERIHIEIMKVLKYDKPSIFFEYLEYIGALEYILPALHNLYELDGGPYHNETVFEHSMICGDVLPKRKPLLRLAGYLHDLGKFPARKVENGEVHFKGHEIDSAELIDRDLRKLKFSNDEIIYLQNLSLLHMRSMKHITPKAIRKLLRKIKEMDVNWKDWLQLKLADDKANLKKDDYPKEKIKDFVLKIREQTKIKPCPLSITSLDINGTSIMDFLGIEPGKKVGEILNYLLEQVLEDPELNTFEKLLELVEEKYKNE